jgi:hypothetical protein
MAAKTKLRMRSRFIGLSTLLLFIANAPFYSKTIVGQCPIADVIILVIGPIIKLLNKWIAVLRAVSIKL